MCRVSTAVFEPELSTVLRARAWVGSRLRRWELDALLDTSSLLTSELVTNAVIHGAGDPCVSVAVADGILEVGVADHRTMAPPSAGERPWGAPIPDERFAGAESGRGLFMVRTMADEWGVAPLARGKQVWFRLSAHDWSYRTSCRCHADDVARVRLKSGRYALALPGAWDDAPD